MNEKYTYINNIRINCDEVLYQKNDWYQNLQNTYISKHSPYLLKLKNIDKYIILSLNNIYTIKLKSCFYTLEDMNFGQIYDIYSTNHSHIKIHFIEVQARLIEYSTSELLFVICNKGDHVVKS